MGSSSCEFHYVMWTKGQSSSAVETKKLTFIDNAPGPNGAAAVSLISFFFFGWCDRRQLLYRLLGIFGILILVHAIILVYYGHQRDCKIERNDRLYLVLLISGGATLTYFGLGLCLILLMLCKTKDHEEYWTIDKVLGSLVYFAYAVVMSEIAILIFGTYNIMLKETKFSECYTPYMLAITMLIAKWVIIALMFIRFIVVSIKRCLRPITDH